MLFLDSFPDPTQAVIVAAVPCCNLLCLLIFLRLCAPWAVGDDLPGSSEMFSGGPEGFRFAGGKGIRCSCSSDSETLESRLNLNYSLLHF